MIPNEAGRVVDPDGGQVEGHYATGWIKRGPSGVIGTNKKDSQETVDEHLRGPGGGQDPRARRPPTPRAIEALLPSAAPSGHLRGLAGDRRRRAGARRAPGPPAGEVLQHRRDGRGRLERRRRRLMADLAEVTRLIEEALPGAEVEVSRRDRHRRPPARRRLGAPVRGPEPHRPAPPGQGRRPRADGRRLDPRALGQDERSVSSFTGPGLRPRGAQRMADAAIREQVEQVIRDNDVLLFMKGTPDAPRCGFSMRVVGVLERLRRRVRRDRRPPRARAAARGRPARSPTGAPSRSSTSTASCSAAATSSRRCSSPASSPSCSASSSPPRPRRRRHRRAAAPRPEPAAPDRDLTEGTRQPMGGSGPANVNDACSPSLSSLAASLPPLRRALIAATRRVGTSRTDRRCSMVQQRKPTRASVDQRRCQARSRNAARLARRLNSARPDGGARRRSRGLARRPAARRLP